MPRVFAFPEKTDDLQQFMLTVRGRGADELDMSVAFGVLLAPIRDRNSRDQEFLVLSNSLMRRTQGDSDQRSYEQARQKVRARNAIEEVGPFDKLLAHVAFPSVSRAAGFFTGRSVDGWNQWKLHSHEAKWTLDEAYRQDSEGEFELKYYTAPPNIIRIPR